MIAGDPYLTSMDGHAAACPHCTDALASSAWRLWHTSRSTWFASEVSITWTIRRSPHRLGAHLLLGYRITLTSGERQQLEVLVRGGKGAVRIINLLATSQALA